MDCIIVGGGGDEAPPPAPRSVSFGGLPAVVEGLEEAKSGGSDSVLNFIYNTDSEADADGLELDDDEDSVYGGGMPMNIQNSLTQKARFLPEICSDLSARSVANFVEQRTRDAGEYEETATLLGDDLASALGDRSASDASSSSRPRGSLGLSKVETEMTASRPRTSRKSDEPSPEGTPVDGTSTHAPQYVAPRVDHVIHKSGWSRFTYTLTLLNVVVWLPLWLKLISVRRHTGSTTPRSLYDPNIGLALHVPSFDDPAGGAACDVCPNGQDVTYPVAATVTNFTKNVPPYRSASYVLRRGAHRRHRRVLPDAALRRLPPDAGLRVALGPGDAGALGAALPRRPDARHRDAPGAREHGEGLARELAEIIVARGGLVAGVEHVLDSDLVGFGRGLHLNSSLLSLEGVFCCLGHFCHF